MNDSDIRLEKAEKCSCMSTPPSRNELEELPRAEANIKLKIMEKSQTEGCNGEMRPVLKRCEWTDLTPAEKMRFFFWLYYITEWTRRRFCDCVAQTQNGKLVPLSVNGLRYSLKRGCGAATDVPIHHRRRWRVLKQDAGQSRSSSQTLNDLIVAAAVFPLKVPCCLKCCWI